MTRFGTLARTGALLCAVVFSSIASAADPQVEALLSNMRNAYKQLKGVTYTTLSQFGNLKYLSDFTFDSPNMIRVSVTGLTTDPPGPLLTVICDGKTVNEKKIKDISYRSTNYSADNVVTDLRVNLESMCFFDWDRQLSTTPGKNMARSTFKLKLNQEWNGKKWTVLEESATIPPVVCTYYIDPKTYIMWRTIIKSKPGGNKGLDCDCKITKLNLAAKVDDSIFKMVRV